MTPANAISGFRCTGILPFNREAIQPPATGVLDRVSTLAQESGLNFIPLYTCSPSRRRPTSSAEETVVASVDDSPNDCLQRQTSVTKCLAKLNAIQPNLLIREKQVKHSGRVLTSAENLMIIKEKEEKKREKELQKDLRKQRQIQRKALKQAKHTLTPAKLPKKKADCESLLFYNLSL